MYKCPNCSSTESFTTRASITYDAIIKFTNNSSHIEKLTLENIVITDNLKCDNCDFEAPIEDYEEC